MEKQRCAYKGCNAWPRKGSTWCVHHPEGQVGGGGGGRRAGAGGRRAGAGSKPGNENARKHGLYATYMSVRVLHEALEVPSDDLRLEIAAARVVVGELLKAELPAEVLAGALEQATGALTRLLRTNQVLNGDKGDESQAWLVRALTELGLGSASGGTDGSGGERTP